MKKRNFDFSCMIPTITFDENLISQLISMSRQKNLPQLVLIAQVQIKKLKVEFHCSSLIIDQESEINIREDEVPIFLKILSEAEYKQSSNNEIDAMKEGFYEMMEETSNQYNANNIYSLISDTTFSNNKLSVRISLFYPKSTVEIEEIDSSDAPCVCSIPGATYRFPKDKKYKDPSSVYAIYYGINDLNDPRIYSLSYSIYLQKRKKILAAFNNKLHRIIFHENEEFDLLTTTFSVCKPSKVTARFNLNPLNENQIVPTEILTSNNNIINQVPAFSIPSELVNKIDGMAREIEELKRIVKSQEEKFQEKIEEHDEEIKTLLQNILSEVVKRNNSQEKGSSKFFSHHSIFRKPVIPLEISNINIFEIQNSNEPTSFNDQQYQPVEMQQQFVQQQPQSQTLTQHKKPQLKQQISSQNQQPLYTIENSINNQNSSQTKLLSSMQPLAPTNIATSSSQERLTLKHPTDTKTSFEKKKSSSKEVLDISAPSISRRTIQTSIHNNNSNITSNNNNSLISNNPNSRVNLSNIKYMNNSNKSNKASITSIENRSGNTEIPSRYSKQSNMFSNQIFNEPSFDISPNIPDSLNDSPSKKESNDPSDLSFIMNNEYSMETKELFKMLSLDQKSNIEKLE